MQTFLPYPDFAESAQVLDRQRLGKQRVEALQILRTLAGLSAGWANHPAVRMWRGYAACLSLYGIAVCKEWRARGYKDNCLVQFLNIHPDGPPGCVQPPWLGDPAFHLSHKSNLVRKLPGHYGELWPGVPDDLPYVWPA